MEDEDLNFCYVEAAVVDKRTSEDSKELHENVWCKIKPPKRSSAMYRPFVTARQLEITRTLLMGKNIPKVEVLPMPSKQKVSLNRKKSSVRFLNKTINDYSFSS